MKCKLHKQKPKVDKKGMDGSLAVHALEGKETTALFFQNERVLSELKKPDIIFINQDGILLKGYEPAGVDRQGRQKFVYQEWFCVFNSYEKLVKALRKYGDHLPCCTKGDSCLCGFDQALEEFEGE